MADGVTWKIIGADKLQDKLEELEKRVANQGLKAALSAGGEAIEIETVRSAPSDTGFMRQHFGHRIQLRPQERAGSIFIGPEGKIDYPKAGGVYKHKVDKKGKRLNVGRIAVASVVRFLEFGTSKMSAKPFMTQAIVSASHRAVDAVITKLKEALGV